MPLMETNQPSSVSRLDLEIRRGVEADLEFVRGLSARVFTVYGSYETYLADWFRSPLIRTFIAVAGVEPVGFTMLASYPSPRDPRVGFADLLAIAVSPEHQSQGVGSFLIRHSLREATRLPSPVPIVEMHLSVAEGNSRGQRLFSKFGFRFQPDRGLYPAGQTALHMACKVTPVDSTQMMSEGAPWQK